MLFSGRAWRQDAPDPIGRGCHRRMGAALAPRFPSPQSQVSGRRESSAVSDAVSTPAPRQVWVAQLPALLSCRGALGLGLRVRPCLWGSPGSHPRSCSNSTLPSSFLSSAPPPYALLHPHSCTCRPGRPLRGTVTWLPGY